MTTTTTTVGANAGPHGRGIRGNSPADRQRDSNTPNEIFLGSAGRSQSNISNRSLSVRLDAAGPSRRSSLSPPLFSANLRRSSDSSDHDNGSTSLTISGLARRIPGSEIIAMEVERNHLLRSVSHLSKDQVATEPILDRADIFDQPIDRSMPFTRFDLLPPPEYEQKIRQPKKPAYGVRGGVRGRSYSDGRRSGYPSTSMTTQEYLESINGTNHSGFSHAYKGGGSGKAKAIFPAAAAKLRKLSVSNLASRKVSVSTPISEDTCAREGNVGCSSSNKNKSNNASSVFQESRQVQSPLPSNTDLTLSHDLSNSNQDTNVSNHQSAIAAGSKFTTGEGNGSHNNLETTSTRATKFGIRQSEKLNTNSTQFLESEESLPNFIYEKDTSFSMPRQFENMDPPEARSTIILFDQDFTAPSASKNQRIPLRDAGCASIDSAPLRGDFATREDENSIRTPQRSEVNTSILQRSPSLSLTEFDRNSPPASATQFKVEVDPLNTPPAMIMQSTSMSSTGLPEFGNSIIESRRGSAPVEVADGRKSGIRLGGMMKLNGSNLDVNRIENKVQGRRGSHLEGSHQRQPSEDAMSNSSSRSHRLSFSSLNRPRRSQDGTRSATFNLFSKFNGNREQVNSPMIDDDGVTSGDGNEKSSKKADAKMSARELIRNAFRRPSLSQVAMTTSNDSASVSPTTHHTNMIDSSSNSGSQDSVSTEATENVFTAAFGTPQRSDLQSGQAFEGKDNATKGVEEGDSYARRSIRHGEGPTTRSSRDSASTSFFSIAEGSQSREAGTPLFDRSHSFTRSVDDQLSRTNSTMLLATNPLAEEGPLGESLRDETIIGDDLLHDRNMTTKLSAQDTTAVQPVTSNGGTASNETLPMATQRSLGLDEEQNMLSSASVPTNNEQVATFGVMEAPSYTSSSNTNVVRRPGRSSHLSHMPRLDSMRVIKKAESTGKSGQGQDNVGGGESNRVASGESIERQSDAHEHNSDTDTGDDTHEEGEDEILSETESEGITEESGDESEAVTSPHRSSSMSNALSSQNIVNSATPSRSSRPGDISLPPVPTFGDDNDNRTRTSAASPFAFASGEDSWTRFESAFTPFETPAISATPTLANPTASAISGRAATASSSDLSTARNVGLSNVGDRVEHSPKPITEANNSSYFDILPNQSRSTGMVPPSPSVITRSRATSSVSKRSLQSPHRELPPLPPITPMQIKSIEALKATGSKSTGTSSVQSKNASTPANIARPVSVASPQDLLTGPTETSDHQINDMYNTAMPPPIAPSSRTISASKTRQDSSRPSLYQQQSRSLIDLSTLAASRQARDDDLKPPPTLLLFPIPPKDATAPESKMDSSVAQSPNASLTPASSSNALRRRRSMFEVGTVPPPYAIIHKRPEGPQMIFPREEEGKEALPRYTCAVHIEGYLPRKMEFSSPGVQAKDRSWRRQYFVLHGTCLKVYKSDLSGENLIAKGAWGEVVQGVHVHPEPMNEDGPVSNPASSSSNAKDGNAQGSSHHGKDTSNGANSNTHHSQGGGGGGNSGLNAAVEVVNSLTGSFHIGNKTGLLKTYSLQGAESGLAADYLKRRHVVRVRVEGEQFLLQTRNDRHVVDWIEAFQAATNVSLDLERRPMPKFITLPRRRRRRRRGAEGAEGPTSASNQEAFDLEEARRRSLMDANSGANMSRSTSSRLPPARPLGLPGDESPDPSAAFDDMLREDQDDLMRRDATAM